MNRKIKKLLYRSFESILSPRKQKILDHALKKSDALRGEKKQLEVLRHTLSSQTEQTFDPFFSDRVMQRIGQLREQKTCGEQFFEAMVSEFRPIAVGAIILFIILVSFNLIRADRLSLASALAEPRVSLEEVYDPVLMIGME